MKKKVAFIEIIENPLQIKYTDRSGKFEFFMVERPSGEAYEDLVIELVQLTNSIGGKTDELEISIKALQAVLEYLRDDNILHLSEVCQPLVNLLSAAEDTLRGANTHLLQRRPISGGGAPTDLAMHRVRALIVMALDTLVEAGSSPEEAARHIRRDLKEVGLVNPKSNKEYSESDLINLRTKARDSTGPKKLIDHLAVLTVG